jgi:hypothetical protein
MVSPALRGWLGQVTAQGALRHWWGLTLWFIVAFCSPKHLSTIIENGEKHKKDKLRNQCFPMFHVFRLYHVMVLYHKTFFAMAIKVFRLISYSWFAKTLYLSWCRASASVGRYSCPLHFLVLDRSHNCRVSVYLCGDCLPELNPNYSPCRSKPFLQARLSD